MPDNRRLMELALKGLQLDRARIDDEIAEITVALRGRITGVAKTRKRTMSAAGRKRISEGMKRRYAAMGKSSQQPQAAKRASSGGITAAGRKKLSEMMKARWAAKKKGGKKAA
jgi:hypothetical protein